MSKINQQLKQAIKENDLETIFNYLSNGFEVNKEMLSLIFESENIDAINLMSEFLTDNMQLFLIAAEEGHTFAFNYLLKNKPTTPYVLEESFFQALSNNHKEISSILLKDHINLLDSEGNIKKILEQACLKGNKDIVDILIDKGISVTYENNTALEYAIKGGHQDLVSYLIEKGADINQTIEFEKPHGSPNIFNMPLYIAATSYNLDLIVFFLEQGLKINNTNDVIVSAIKTKLFHQENSIRNNDDFAEIIDKLILHGLDIHVSNEYLFVSACQKGHMPLFKFLLNKNVDIRVFDNDPLNAACKYNQTEIIKELISLGVNIKHKNNLALKVAAFHDSLESCELLIENGADIYDNKDVVSNTIFSRFLNLVNILHTPSIYKHLNGRDAFHTSIYAFRQNIESNLAESVFMAPSKESDNNDCLEKNRLTIQYLYSQYKNKTEAEEAIKSLNDPGLNTWLNFLKLSKKLKNDPNKNAPQTRNKI